MLRTAVLNCIVNVVEKFRKRALKKFYFGNPSNKVLNPPQIGHVNTLGCQSVAYSSVVSFIL
jgi:hypothetical protein